MTASQETTQSMDKATDAFHVNIKKIRAGRASASLLDNVQVQYYGNATSLNQVATVKVEDSRTLSVTPWEKNLIPEIEKAILASRLGLNPSTQGITIRVPLPMLTEETRQDYIKQARAAAESARIVVRNIRHTGNDKVKEEANGEDDERRLKNDIQKITDEHIAQIDALLKDKEEELLTI